MCLTNIIKIEINYDVCLANIITTECLKIYEYKTILQFLKLVIKYIISRFRLEFSDQLNIQDSIWLDNFSKYYTFSELKLYPTLHIDFSF